MPANDILQNPLLLRKRLVRIDVAAELRDESEDAARRALKGKEVSLGKRNIAYRLEDVLMLGPDDVLDPRIEERLSEPAAGRGSRRPEAAAE